jgi:CheY-like chemotaxis protein
MSDPTDNGVHALDRPGLSKHYGALKGLRVLFVDDDRPTREAVREVLTLSGIEVVMAASSAEAMTSLEAFRPQVILSDLGMPVEDGYTFMRRVRARESRSGEHVPALALSAFASEDSRRRALGAGFQLLLAKPIDIDLLRDALLELAAMVGLPKEVLLSKGDSHVAATLDDGSREDVPEGCSD